MTDFREVAVGVLIRLKHRGQAEILFARRTQGAYQGYWELPGGKVDNINGVAEDIETALKRELKEEVGITLTQYKLFKVVESPKDKIRLHFFICTKWIGEVVPCEGQILKWASGKSSTRDDLTPMLPLTLPLLPEIDTLSQEYARKDQGWQCGRFNFSLGEMPLIMGVLNITPDSFFDGGRYQSQDKALQQAQILVEQGASIIDVGAESSRPGAQILTADEEWQRLEPILKQLLTLSNTAVSVDTYHAQTMRKALDLGVDMINDITGFVSPENRAAVADSKAGLCVMHSPAKRHAEEGKNEDVVSLVGHFFTQQLKALENDGIALDRVCLDPGFGFGKNGSENWQLMQALNTFLHYKLPLLIGVSHKRFLGEATGRDTQGRLVASLAAQLISLHHGAEIIRVHHVAEMKDTLAIWHASGRPRFTTP